jgi:hypothetical protein
MEEDYYKKYLKYKNKYLELKSKSLKTEPVEPSDYLSELKKLYPECQHDKTVKELEQYKKYATTYGEMEYESIEKINSLLNSTGQFKYFIDFGSGRGKLPLFMGLKVDKSIGIELVKERADDADQLLNKLKDKFPEITSKVTLISGDMFKYLDTVKPTDFTSKVLIWISNLCFGEEITSQLFQKLVEKMPSGSVIMCSKIPDKIPERMSPLTILKTNTIEIPMSWSKSSVIHLYKIN